MMKIPYLLVIGFILLFSGAALPFMMVIKLLESTFLLNILAYACTVSGLVVGFTGIAYYHHSVRK